MTPRNLFWIVWNLTLRMFFASSLFALGLLLFHLSLDGLSAPSNIKVFGGVVLFPYAVAVMMAGFYVPWRRYWHLLFNRLTF